MSQGCGTPKGSETNRNGPQKQIGMIKEIDTNCLIAMDLSLCIAQKNNYFCVSKNTEIALKYS